SKILNIVFIVIISVSLSIFTISLFSSQTEQEHDKTKSKVVLTKTEEKSIDWETLITSIGGVAGLLLKWRYQKWKMDSAKTSPAINTLEYVKHPMFSMIEEILLTEIKNLNLGQPGRTELFKV